MVGRPEKILWRQPLDEKIRAHIGQQVVLAKGYDMLVIEGQAGNAGPFGCPWREIFKICNADIGLETVNQTLNMGNVLFPLKQKRKRARDCGPEIDLVVFEDSPKIGDAFKTEFRLKHLRRVIAAHKKKFMFGHSAGYCQAPHGMAMPRAMHCVEYFRHEAIINLMPSKMQMIFAMEYFRGGPSLTLSPLRQLARAAIITPQT